MRAACGEGRVEAARLLIERSSRSLIDDDCLLDAVANKHVEMVRALLQWQHDYPFESDNAAETALATALRMCGNTRHWDNGDDRMLLDASLYAIVKLLLEDLRWRLRWAGEGYRREVVRPEHQIRL